MIPPNSATPQTGLSLRLPPSKVQYDCESHRIQFRHLLRGFSICPSRRKRDHNKIFNGRQRHTMHSSRCLYTRWFQVCSIASRVSNPELFVFRANNSFAELKAPGNRIPSRTAEPNINSLQLTSFPTSTRSLFKATDYMRNRVLRQPSTPITMFRNFIHQRFLQSPMAYLHGTLSARFKSRTALQFRMVDSSVIENLGCFRNRMYLPRRVSGILTSSPHSRSVTLYSTSRSCKR